jgi:hypothetical protein
MNFAFKFTVTFLLLTMAVLGIQIGNAQRSTKPTPPVAAAVPARTTEPTPGRNKGECLLAGATEYRRRTGIHPDAAMPWSEINRLLESCE